MSCANCGKTEEEGNALKACVACKMVKYCNRECQIAHRPQHKRECKKRAAELHDEKLFKQLPPYQQHEKLFKEPPPLEDCPICMIQLPNHPPGRAYMNCCGQDLCTGCIHEFQSKLTRKKDDVCPLCRTPPPQSSAETIKRYEQRMELNDPLAVRELGSFYNQGKLGLIQNHAKALELWYRAAELGHAQAYYDIGCAYRDGINGVEVDMKKARQYTEMAAIRGYLDARYDLGCFEGQAGSMEKNTGKIDRALKHWMIAVKGGDRNSLEGIQKLYRVGLATKDDYAKALRSYQSYQDQIRSDHRDEAAAFHNIPYLHSGHNPRAR